MTNAKDLNKYLAELILVQYQEALKKAKITYSTDITYKITNNNIELIIPKEIDYQEFGRKARTKKVPIKALIEWARKKRFLSPITTAWKIQYKIFKKGIRPKKVNFDIDKTIESIDISEQLLNLASILNK